EEFPVVLTIFMALGAWRISQKKVLTRRFPAIEMLGSATVICVDKTGTLTENRMTVQEVFVAADGIGRDELLRVAALASEQHTADSVDKAVVAAAPGTQPPGPLLREYPLSPECMLVAKAYEYADHTVFIAAKGAPEQIFKLEPRQSESRIRCESALKQMTENGMRVIAVAAGEASQQHLPSDKSALKLNVLGLIGLADPIRATVPHAITELAGAGIRVIMITGDYPATASVIAGKAGLSHPENVISGKSLEDMDEEELRARVRDCNVFARIRPEQKLQLVNALKANGEIVAMTGDGVNDAPALKAAHIGIAMGARGADVAREAASLVLSDDDFPAIADAVRLGRRIYDNLVKAVRYVFAAHVPIAGMAVLPVVFNWPILLMPLHIVFFELIVDPACSVAFESEADEPGIMRRLPRSPSARLFGSGTVWTGLLQGIGVFVAVLAAFGVALHRGQSPEEARAIAFTTLVVGNVALIWANRSWARGVFRTLVARNRALWAVTVGSLATLLVILYSPQGRALFGFSFLHVVDLTVAFGLGLLTIGWCEILKLASRGKEGAYTRA
ncbi:MAG TPA: cation-translocating P-type ATPase, partial [Terriglobales bacterium]